MIKIAVCDDLERESMRIKKWILYYAKKSQLEVFVDIYMSGEELIHHYGGQYDLLILDIEMKHMNGVQVAKYIRDFDEEVRIVFATQYQDYAYQSFQVQPSGYFLKAQDYSAFENVLKKALNQLTNRKRRILITYHGNSRLVELSSIVFVEYFEHKLEIHFMDGTVLIMKGTLKNFLNQDTNGMLLRIHKNCLVNKLWVERCEERKLFLKGIRRPFEVSRPKWKEIEEEYLTFCRERFV